MPPLHNKINLRWIKVLSEKNTKERMIGLNMFKYIIKGILGKI